MPDQQRSCSCFPLCQLVSQQHISHWCVRAMAATALRRSAESTPGGSSNQSWSTNSGPTPVGDPRGLAPVLVSEHALPQDQNAQDGPQHQSVTSPLDQLTTRGVGPVPTIWERPNSINNGDKFPVPTTWKRYFWQDAGSVPAIRGRPHLTQHRRSSTDSTYQRRR